MLGLKTLGGAYVSKISAGLQALVNTELMPTEAYHGVGVPSCTFEEIVNVATIRAEAVGRTLRLIQGPATDGAVVDDLLRDVQLRLPSSMIVVNYHRDGTKFINYLRVFPLYRDGDAPDDYSHYLGELERLDDDVVAHIERTFHWELAATATTPQPPPQRPPGGQPA